MFFKSQDFENLDVGHIYFDLAQTYANKNFIKKLFFKDYYLEKAIRYYTMAAKEFEFINDTNMSILSISNAIDQCYNLDKFTSLETVNVILLYILICNHLKISVYTKKRNIEYFEINAVPFLEKKRNISK